MVLCCAERRINLLPNVPTLDEQGLKGFEVKETKKKPAKTQKEKRADKAAKKG